MAGFLLSKNTKRLLSKQKEYGMPKNTTDYQIISKKLEIHAIL